MIDYKKVTDEDLFGMCRAGDGGAWTYVFNCVLTICNSKKWYRFIGHLSEDIASEVTKNLIKTVQLKNNVKEQEKFSHLITVSAVNKIKDVLKSPHMKNISIDEPRKGRGDDEGKREKGAADEIIGGKEGDQMAHIERLEIALLLNRALENISKECRTVLSEYFQYKMGAYKRLEEISKVLKMSVSLFSTRVNRCMKKMLEMPEVKQLREYM